MLFISILIFYVPIFSLIKVWKIRTVIFFKDYVAWEYFVILVYKAKRIYRERVCLIYVYVYERTVWKVFCDKQPPDI